MAASRSSCGRTEVAARVLIGTSGWHYDSWRGPFFPKGLPLKEQLRYYGSQFSTTELNGVFYRTPSQAAVRDWKQQTGREFVFAWKASRFITHWKRLSENSVNSLDLLDERLSLLGSKAGPVLFQLPPNFPANAERLASFFKLLPKRRRYSFEFRHPSWYSPPIMRLLTDRNVSLCISAITMLPRRGSAPQTSSTSGVTVPVAATAGTTVAPRSASGPGASDPGSGKTVMFTSISTTTRRVRPRLTLPD